MNKKPIGTDFKAIFLAWEKLRMLYVALVGIAVLVLTFLVEPNLFKDYKFWIGVAEGAVIANIAFFAGPIVESYLTWLGNCPRWYRKAAMIGGIVFTILLAMLVIGAFGFSAALNPS